MLYQLSLLLQPIEDGSIDAAIHRVLEGTGKPEVGVRFLLLWVVCFFV